MLSPIKAAHKWLFETHPRAGVATIYGSLNVVGDTCAQVFFSEAAYDPIRTLRFFIFGFGIAPLALMWNTYLERKYPLRVSNDIDLASIPTAPEYVPLESVKVDAPPSSSDSPRLHRRTASTVSAQGDDHKLVLPSEAPAVKPKLPPVDRVVLLRRIAADQVFMAPISFVVFLVCMGLMEFRTPTAILVRIRTALLPILLTNYKVWPFVQCAMFLYVPLQYRVPLSGIVNVAWTIYLSWENAR
ncbi:hypothetical protein BMF94_1354 [Rhodotorula taiwanensis]|uniref:Uncharacterized protein n=1 Tax=Rhodotorula taiwanensis TaxID=741276 RepID=A0A2S5BG46_9BASI|nr:hypothetical protein BMF94_1354 [Rhodotorula taiwanensis]